MKSLSITIALLTSIIHQISWAEALPYCPIDLVTTNWAPYYSQKLVKEGFFTEICRTAFARFNCKMNVSFMPWDRAVKGTMKGLYSGVLGIYHSDERAQELAYSRAIYHSEEVLVHFGGIKLNSYSTLEDLKNFTIGTIKGSLHSEEFNQANFLHKYPAQTTLKNIKRIQRGRIELFADSKLVVLDAINKKYPKLRGKLVIIKPPLSRASLYVAISKKEKNHIELIKNLNLAIDSMEHDGTTEKILSDFGFEN